MTRLRQLVLCLMLTAACAASAQNGLAAPKPAATNQVSAPQPKIVSPVSYFRKLLAMTPAERTNSLANRPPETRERILAKVEEYELLPPEAREIRLRATDLRWWLTPMLSLAPADQQKRLAQAPAEFQPLIKSRLEQWSILPPPLQQEFLDNDRAMHYFTLMPPGSAAPTAEQQRIASEFNRFFELTPEEKTQTLSQLSDDEREKMEQTLKAFDHLPPPQRQLCVENYAKFAGMSSAERADFLKNAERWAKLSPEERQEWRELVQQVPIWPVGWTPNQSPPLPPGAVPDPKTVATNLN